MAREFICGFACGIVYASISASHWAGVTGTGASIIDNGDGTGTLQIDTTGGAQLSYVQHTFNPSTHRTKVVRFYFTPLTTPAATTGLFTFISNNGMRINYASTGKLQAQAALGTVQNSANVGTAGVLTVGQKYRIDAKFDRSGATATVDWYIDGVAQTQATSVVAAADMTDLRIGFDVSTTAKCKIDDLVVDTDGTVFPIGASYVKYFEPNANGSHSFTAGDFQDDTSTNLGTTETTSWSKLDGRPPTTTAHVKQVVIRSTGYLEYAFPVAPTTPKCVQVCASVHITGGTQANTQKTVLYDGTTTVDAYALQITGAVVGTLRNIVGMVATPPSGGTWTKALFDVTRLRWGYSTDVTNTPALDGLSIEAEFNYPIKTTLTATVDFTSASPHKAALPLAATVDFASASAWKSKIPTDAALTFTSADAWKTKHVLPGATLDFAGAIANKTKRAVAAVLDFAGAYSTNYIPGTPATPQPALTAVHVRPPS